MTHVLKRIRLDLARGKDYPNGSTRHGYEFTAPLDGEGRIDLASWRKLREQCTVRRFWAGERDEIGHLIHKSGGAKGATWIFDYDGSATDDDEAGYRFGDHVFQIGEYVSVRDEDGVLHTFQVASVENA